MPYLAAFTVLVGLIAVLNLVLTFGVIKQLRDHTELLVKGGTGKPKATVCVPAGESPTDFAATTLDGEPLTRQSVAGSFVAFLTPFCETCEERVADVLGYSESLRLGREDVLAVLIGTEEETAELAGKLRGVARLAVESPAGGPIGTAFSVVGYPALALLDTDGSVIASGADLRSFPKLAPVLATSARAVPRG
jgi:hypothetical protein